ncbi:SPOR domain-containing protein [Rhodoflexus sp.]
MRKVFQILLLLSSVTLLPALAQRQSATINVKIVANSESESWHMVAHKSLPLGMHLHTSTQAANSPKIVLKVNRILPKNSPHEMEISQAAADSLGISGTQAMLRIEYSPMSLPRSGQVVADAYREVSANRPEPAAKGRVYYDNEEVPVATAPKPEADKKPTVTANKPTATQSGAVTKKTQKNPPDNKNSKPAPTGKKQAFAAPGTYDLRGTKVAVKGFGLQLHAFNEVEKAVKVASDLESKKLGKVYIRANSAAPRYRVILGVYPTKVAADKAAKELKTKQQLSAIVKPHL